MRSAIAAAAVCAWLAGSALAGSAESLPSAFSRPAVDADRLPLTVHGLGESPPYDSRRIATYDGTKRRWSVYIYKQRIRHPFDRTRRARVNVCLLVFEGGGGGTGCSPASSFFGPGRQVNASSSRVLAGVASDRVARVVVIGSLGVVHKVPLTPDHGFIFNWRAYNGCACVVARLQAFDDNDRLITNQLWLTPARRCP